MVRGTTPTLTFTLPFSTTTIADGFVTFQQNGKNVLDIPKTEWTITDANNIAVTLDQAETLLFEHGTAKIQIRAKLSDGSAVASEIISVAVGNILRDGSI